MIDYLIGYVAGTTPGTLSQLCSAVRLQVQLRLRMDAMRLILDWHFAIT